MTEGSDFSTNIQEDFVFLDVAKPYKNLLFQNYCQENAENPKETTHFNTLALEFAEKGQISESLQIFEKCLFFPFFFPILKKSS